MSAEEQAARFMREQAEVDQFRSAVRTLGGKDISADEARLAIARQQEREQSEERRLFERLEQARPEFMTDGHGVRGPQREINAITIAGADGGQGNFQVRKPKTDGVSGRTSVNGGPQEGLIYFDDAAVNGAPASYYLRGREVT